MKNLNRAVELFRYSQVTEEERVNALDGGAG